MNSQDFAFLATMLKTKSGHILAADKGYLLDSRLGPIARKENFDSVDALISAMRTRNDERLNSTVAEAMTTNETFFFRDRMPFDVFKKDVIPSLVENRPTASNIKIWCAAASTGQEPYSLAMILNEEAGRMQGMKNSILATDISEKVLQKARAGLYSQFEVQRGLPVQLMVKYFEKSDDLWRIAPALQQNINFRKFNLLDSFTGFGKFDVIFCRNVLIYFDQETKGKILNRMADSLAPDGFLFLGAAETVIGITDRFAPVTGKRGLYVRNDQVGASARVA